MLTKHAKPMLMPMATREIREMRMVWVTTTTASTTLSGTAERWARSLSLICLEAYGAEVSLTLILALPLTLILNVSPPSCSLMSPTSSPSLDHKTFPHPHPHALLTPLG